MSGLPPDDEKIQQVATISANNDLEIGKIIAKAMNKAKNDGVITVEEAKGMETTVDEVDGIQIDRGYISPYFVTNPEKQSVEFENPYVLVTTEKIANVSSLVPLLEVISQKNVPLFIVCKDLENDVLTALIINKAKGIIRVAAIKSPGFGDVARETIEDIAIMTGTTVISNSQGVMLNDITIDNLGSAEKIIVTKDDTTIIRGRCNPKVIKKRINDINDQLKISTSEYEVANLKSRLAKLTGSVAIIYVGAVTELEMKEKKDRIDDALSATKAAIEEGIVPGGGMAYLLSAKKISNDKDFNEDQNKSMSRDQLIGFDLLINSVQRPFHQILINAGIDSEVILDKLVDADVFAEEYNGMGYNVNTKELVNMLAAGVIDPTKVVRIALENAVSVACIFLTTECVIADEPKQESEEPKKNSKFKMR